jgi:hypothetical protein
MGGPGGWVYRCDPLPGIGTRKETPGGGANGAGAAPGATSKPYAYLQREA